MKSTRRWWLAVGGTALAATLLCAGGFVYAVSEIMNPRPAAETGVVQRPEAEKPAAPEETWESKEQIRIVALGDSLTAGTGDLSGRGYVGQLKEKLQARWNKPVYVYNNFAIPGYRTTDVLRDWDDKRDIAEALKEADLVLLTIGGNDLFDGGRDMWGANGDAEAFNPQGAEGRMDKALQRLDEIFSRMAKAAPQARILYMGLYHPFLDLDDERLGAPIVQRWNGAAFELANKHPNITVVPTYDLFQLHLNKYLYSDHFHPNQEGYERIAERMADTLQ